MPLEQGGIDLSWWLSISFWDSNFLELSDTISDLRDLKHSNDSSVGLQLGAIGKTQRRQHEEPGGSSRRKTLFPLCFRELKLPEIILKASVRILLIRFIDKESARRILQKRRHRTSVMRLLNYDRYAGMSARRQWEALIVGIFDQQESESCKKK